MFGELGSAPSELSQVVAALDAGAGELSTAAGAADSALMNVRMLSAMSAQIARGLDGAAHEAQRAGESTRQALLSVDEMARRMEALQALVAEIDSVVSEITAIAGHTRMLALNAAIEAARAGDRGLGFAVVAGEVKRLAGQTTEATRTISGRLVAIQQAVHSAGEASDVVRSGMGDMQSTSSAVAASILEQAEMARSVGSYIDEAVGSVEGLSQVATQVSERLARVREGVGEALVGSADGARGRRGDGSAGDDPSEGEPSEGDGYDDPFADEPYEQEEDDHAAHAVE